MNQTERKRIQRAISLRYFWRFVVQVALLNLFCVIITWCFLRLGGYLAR